jgi:hypothetical protein
MTFPSPKNDAVSKSDSQQLSIMGFVLLDTPAALLVAFGREDPTVYRDASFCGTNMFQQRRAQAQDSSIMKIGIIGAG